MAAAKRFSLAEGDFIAGTPYRVVRAIDLGGMGEVYEVDHTRAGTRRAIKVVRETVDPRAKAADRLRQEGQALRLVDHPNVVRVYEVGELPDGRPYFAMELLEGCTLRKLAKNAPLGLPRAVHLVVQALDGLHAVHERGIVHRDVKPTNLLVLRGDRVKVLDFGIAKMLRGGQDCVRTSEGQVLGTTRYMAPEQLRGRAVDARADVYAAAIVFFEVASNVHPFEFVAGASGSVSARLHRPAPYLSDVLGNTVSPAIDDVLHCALSRDPEGRFDSAKDFAAALREAIGEPVHAFRFGSADPHATTRVCPVQVTLDDSVACAEALPLVAVRRPQEIATVPAISVEAKRDDTPTAVDVPHRPRASNLITSACALVLALTAVCLSSLRACSDRDAAVRGQHATSAECPPVLR